MSSQTRFLLGLTLLAILPAVLFAGFPEELSFLEDMTPPDYYYTSGVMIDTDTAGMTFAELPFRFYWEKGSYAMDVRRGAGSPIMFARGVADTIWLYDFQNGVKLVLLHDQEFAWLSQMPFSPRDILPIFNLFPAGFEDIDTFYTRGESTFVTLAGGAVYEFEPETGSLLSIDRDGSIITCTDFVEGRGKMWPREVRFNKGLFTGTTGSIKIYVDEPEFAKRPEDDREMITMDLPPSMPREFDLRTQAMPQE